MAKSTKQKRAVEAIPASETRKKSKMSTKESVDSMDIDATQVTRRSGRLNLGKGGQKVQLENIERVQVQRSARTSKLDVATLNEPLNPMAPVANGRDSTTTPVDTVRTDSRSHPSARQPGLPTFQPSVQGSRYGFHGPEGGSAASLSRGRFPAVSTFTHTRYGSTPAASRSGSAVPTSRDGSAPPTSRDGSIAPISRSGSTHPTSRSASIPPISHSATSRVEPTPFSLPLRSSQIAQRTRVSSTGIHSARGVEDMTRENHTGPRHPSYRSHDLRNDNDTRDAPDDLDIDEQSPDEDEQLAEQALRGGDPDVQRHRSLFDDSVIDPVLLAGQPYNGDIGAVPDPSEDDARMDLRAQEHANDDDAYDVVTEYHQRNLNRFPRPPDPSNLRNVRLQQENFSSGSQSRSGWNIESRSRSEESSVPTQALSSDDPPGPLTGSATKFRSYPHKFREVIERAKQISQCECALVDPFPNRADFLDRKSGEHFTEAILECQHVPKGYWPQYKKDLGILLWEALMTWRSTLKAKAHEVVPRFYELSEDQPPEINKTNAERLIRGSAFTRDGVDEEGSTNNMASPALASLITSFFYTGPSALGILFPEVFGREVPEVTVCFAATALRAAIDEYVSITGARQDRTFEYAGYSKIYANFHAMQLAINKDPKHAAKTKTLRVQWAAPAREPAHESTNIIAFDTDFQPVLD